MKIDITIKTNWNDVTLKEYNALQSIFKSDSERLSKEIQILEVLTDRSYTEIEQLPVGVLKKLINKTKFLSEPPKGQLKYEYMIDGDKYIPRLMIQDFEAGRFIDIQSFLKEGEEANLHLIIASIIDRKIEYPWYKFWKQNTVESYSEKDIKELADKLYNEFTVTDAAGLSTFFLRNYVRLWKTIEDSLEGEQKKMWMKNSPTKMMKQSRIKKDGVG